MDESIATAIELPDDAALHAYISALLKPWGFNLCQITRKPYGYDARINCDLDIVTVDGYGVMGFIDSPRGRGETVPPCYEQPRPEAPVTPVTLSQPQPE